MSMHAKPLAFFLLFFWGGGDGAATLADPVPPAHRHGPYRWHGNIEIDHIRLKRETAAKKKLCHILDNNHWNSNKLYLLCHLLEHSWANLSMINFIPTVTAPLSRSWLYNIFLPPNLWFNIKKIKVQDKLSKARCSAWI